MDIVAWLKGLELDRYSQLFLENDVDASVLPQLTADDLTDMGIILVGHRRKLLDAIAALRNARAEDPSTEGVTAGPVHPEPGRRADAERRQLTVMFVDLVDSTALSSRLDPEEMREVIRAYQNTVTGEISRLDGFTAKLMGDGVLAYFGWPRTREDEAERAVRTGLAVASAVSKLRGGGVSLAARIGIATGLVVVGDLIGEGATQEQAVVGDTPNLAARLQAIAEPGMVVISEMTRRLVGDLFVMRTLGARTFKGIHAPVTTYAVVGERALESRFAARQGHGVTPIVGRDQELALLLERWRQAKTWEGQVVLLTGEAGIGKSRITEAIVEHVATEPHILLRYQCSPYHVDSALYPVIQQIRFAAGFAMEERLEARLDRLEELLGRGTSDPLAAAPLIATLVGLDGSARYGDSMLTPQQSRGRTLATLVDQLVGLAADRPVLWVVEDAHWIDPTTLELIEQALDQIQGMRILALITARPTFVASFASHPVVTRVALNRLAREATQAIVARITRGKLFPDTVVDEIAARTDGVPLFVEEMTKAVLESGQLQETDHAFHLDGPLNALAIPATLHDSLMARLDRLQPVKEVAQIASIIGRSFEHETIAALAGMPEPDLIEAMRKLVEAELVFRRGTPPDATYLFKHALVRDAAYESMLKSRCKVLHLRLLGILQDNAAPPEILAQHAQAGGDPGRAIGWWHEAAEAAIGRVAFAEAEAHLDSASAHLSAMGDDLPRRRAEATLAITRANASLVRYGYGHERTKTLYARADALAQDSDDPSLFMLARYGVWAVYHVRENVVDALAVAEDMREVAVRRNDPQFTMMAHRLVATSQTMAGRLIEARHGFETARTLYDPQRDTSLRAKTGTEPLVAIKCYLSFAELALGFPDRAHALVEEAWDSIQGSGQVNATAYAMWHRVILAACAGEATRSRALAEDAALYTGQRGLQFWEAMSRVFVAWGTFATGDPAGAADVLPGLIETAETTGGGLFGALSRAVLAEAQAATGSALAFETIAQAEALARRSGAFYGLAEIQRREGVIVRHLRPDDLMGAEAALRRSLATAREQGARFWELRTACDLARLMTEQGRRTEAQHLLEPLYGWFTEGFETTVLIEARTQLIGLRSGHYDR